MFPVIQKVFISANGWSVQGLENISAAGMFSQYQSEPVFCGIRVTWFAIA
jgi:hypothetical protein